MNYYFVSRYQQDVKQLCLLDQAAFLDPRVKLTPYLSASEKLILKDSIIDQLVARHSTSSLIDTFTDHDVTITKSCSSTTEGDTLSSLLGTRKVVALT